MTIRYKLFRIPGNLDEFMEKAQKYKIHNIDIYKIMEVQKTCPVLYLKIKANGFILTTEKLKTNKELTELEAKKLNLEEAIVIAEKLIENGFHATIDKEPLHISKQVAEYREKQSARKCHG